MTSDSRLAFVTGGTGGIGAATCEVLAKSGMAVIAADLEAPRTDPPTGVRHMRLDVTSDADWSSAAQDVKRVGRLDVLVLCAYAIRREPAATASPASWLEQLEVNVGQVQRALFHFDRLLRATPGASVVLVSSVHAAVSAPNHSAYAASKGAMESLTRQLAVEYAPAVRVNAVRPGSVDTQAWDAVAPEDRAAAAAQTPLGRIGEAREIADVIGFVASPAASFMTGATVTVDGGWLASKG